MRLLLLGIAPLVLVLAVFVLRMLGGVVVACYTRRTKTIDKTYDGPDGQRNVLVQSALDMFLAGPSARTPGESAGRERWG